MLDPDALAFLDGKRNLLAFSGGVDSTALFFLLEDAGIAFDIAHVNYHTRTASNEEADYARSLAERFGKKCFLHDAPGIGKNFEALARRERYDFFASLIDAHGYETVITAHQLDDRLEWLLMQLCKGAGVPELLGMEPMAVRDGYHLVRPLLFAAKDALKSWLDERKIGYFEDESNRDERFKRNRFRQQFSSPLLKTYRSGIEKSFRYLAADAAQLVRPEEGVRIGDVVLFRSIDNRLQLMRNLDRWFKSIGILMRQGEKERLLEEDELVISRRYALSIGPAFAIAAPIDETVMQKAFKEQCRRLGIGPTVRPYLFTHPAIFEQLLAALRHVRPENAT